VTERGPDEKRVRSGVPLLAMAAILLLAVVVLLLGIRVISAGPY
jgi:type VI protein secretion system component VasF